MTNEKGFTLIEMLVVLFIVTLLILISVPITYSVKEEIEWQAFKEQLKADVLYTQNEAYHHQRTQKLSFINDKEYVLRTDRIGDELIYRSIPPTVSSTLKDSNITYNAKGTIVNPGTYSFLRKGKSYRLVFPFGKGRYRITEN